MRVCTIIGARPQFVKAAVVSQALRRRGIEEDLLHTGQHYDAAMSDIFFQQLGLPPVAANLGAGSATHARQTAAIMTGLDDWLRQRDRYDWVIVFGDTNSTLAGALVASKLHIPIAHVEAGLRSFDHRMPEEVNRVVTDQISDLLFCPTDTAIENLRREGVAGRLVASGDVMRDAVTVFLSNARGVELPEPLARVCTDDFALATVHRAHNTDDPNRLAGILEGFSRAQLPVLFLVHPRTRIALRGMSIPDNVVLSEPVGYLHTLRLLDSAVYLMTDSGGMQKEAYWLSTPCITLRDETEWTETLTNGWNQLAGTDPECIATSAQRLPPPDAPQVPIGEVDGLASDVVARELMR